MTNSEIPAALRAAAADRVYFRPTSDDKIAYVAGPGARTFVAAPHMWLDEIVIEVGDEIVGRRKTAKGALSLLVKLADAEYAKR